MPKIWLNVGNGNCAGRFPKNENELSIYDESEILKLNYFVFVIHDRFICSCYKDEIKERYIYEKEAISMFSHEG